MGAWQEMGREEWLLIAMLSGVIAVGSVGAALAYQRGASSVVATFDFAYVAFAALWGFVLFREALDPRSILGILLITTAG